MAKPKVPLVDLELVRGPINTVWNAIAYDMSELPGRMSNAAMVEACIDADRLTFFAPGSEKAKLADAEISRAIDAHGYDKVLRFLSKNISLGF